MYVCQVFSRSNYQGFPFMQNEEAWYTTSVCFSLHCHQEAKRNLCHGLRLCTLTVLYQLVLLESQSLDTRVQGHSTPGY